MYFSDDLGKNEEWLKEQYLVHEKTVEEIAHSIGRNHGFIHRNLRKFGIHILRQEQRKNKLNEAFLIASPEKIQEMYVDMKMSAAEIGKALNLSKRVIYRAIDKAGIKKRKKIKEPYTDFRNQQFGKLTVVDKNGGSVVYPKMFWLCKCVCGNYVDIADIALKNKILTSCGCDLNIVNEQYITWRGYEEIGVTFWHIIRDMAKRRGLSFTITPEYVWELFLKQDRKCALSGLPIEISKRKGRLNKNSYHGTASLDRISSFSDYEEGNVQWLHKTVNRIKGCLPQDIFLAFCKLIAENNVIDISKIPSSLESKELEPGKFKVNRDCINEIYIV